MQTTRDVTQNAQPSPFFDAKGSKLRECVYQAAILIAVILLVWTAA
jgi:hypothetical protein